MTEPRIRWWRTDLGDDAVERLAAAVRDRRITCGELTREFEKRLEDYLGVRHAVMTANGALALVAALLACGVRPGDEVIVPGLTFVATANAAAVLGARVRLVDVEPDRTVIDAGRVEEAIGERTRAIVPVHLNGRAADLETIREIARRRGVTVIEDAAQALGSRNAAGFLGTRGDAGCFSFSITKLVTTGEGGAVATGDDELAGRLRRVRNNGVEDLGSGRFDTLGLNLRPTDLAAAIGLSQMDGIDARVRALNEHYASVRDALGSIPGFSLMPVETERGELPLWIEVLCPARDEAIRLLSDRGIQARAFHPPLSNSAHLGESGDLPRSAFFARHGLILPSGPDQTSRDLDETLAALRRVGPQLPDWPRGIRRPAWVE